MRRRLLGEWLEWQSTLHPSAIDLGLDRCRRVRDAMGLDKAPEAHRPPRIVVAGTNGKGSCVAFLEAMLTAAGLRTGAYTSPHLSRYNERVRIGARAVSDAALVEAFERVDAARGDISLTFFEFGTLAAADIIERARVDAVVMEVGLGGRLDAVNAFEPSVSLITAIDVDHRAWLGDDRESVGREKAGIMRPAVPCVVGERSPPASVVDRARTIGAPCRIPGRDYGYDRGRDRWSWWSASRAVDALPPPGLAGAHQIRQRRGVSRRPRCAVAAGTAERRRAAPRESRAHGSRGGSSGSTHRRGSSSTWLTTRSAPRRSRPIWPRFARGRGGARCAGSSETRTPAPCCAHSHRRSTCGISPRCPARAGAMRGRLAGKLPGTATGLAFDSVEAALAAALADRGGREEVVVFGSFVTVERTLRLATSPTCPET